MRSHLIMLVAGTLLPVVLFAGVVVYKLSIQEQEAAARRTLQAARRLSNTVEREVASTARALQALAASKQLDSGEVTSFYQEAERVLPTQPTWSTVILLTPDGRPIMNIKQPFNLPLPSVNEPDSLERVVRTRQPMLGNLVVDTYRQRLAFPIRIPVMRNGELQYILTAVITPQALATIVREQDSVEGEWTRTVVDGRGVVVARTRNPERFVGQQGTPSFLKRIGETTEGVYRDTTLEGKPVYVAFSRVSGSDWTVAVTVPVAVIQGPTRQAMGIVIGSGLFLLIISGAGAIMLSRRISQGITSAATAAAALAKGQHPQVSASSIHEVEMLGQSLAFSADLLAQREQERTENLARAEAAREEAEAANRIKDEFLAVLSHELRSPLNPILGWAKLLQTQTLDEKKTAHALEIIERNAKLQTQLIEDLLDISRILRGKLLLNQTPVNLVSVIEAALETVTLAAEAKEIQIHTALNPTVGPILGDPARLQQIMWNLLSNAVKFTPSGGTVEVRLNQVDTCAQIQVQDTGKGISPTFLPYIFEYFRQEDGTTTRKFGGLGLGLAIVHHLTELHGGTIEAESAGENQGATFTVRLPLLKNKNVSIEDVPPAHSMSSESPLSRRRILVVDDEPAIRDVVSFILEQAGAAVAVANSATSAFAEIDEALPDVVICDIAMPDVDGYMFMKQLRTRSPKQGGTIPAIALTAFAGDEDRKNALAAGYQRHLTKPIEPEALVAATLTVLPKPL